MNRSLKIDGLLAKDRKLFFFSSLLILLLLCNGCFTYETTRFCGRMHNEIQILERRGELSNDGQYLIVHMKKQTNYCRDPFKKWRGSFVEESTHVYSLTTPEPDALRKEFLIILDEHRMIQRVQLQNYEIKNGEESTIEQNDEVNLGRLILPAFYIYPRNREGTSDIYSTLSIHPDDIHFLSHPFVWKRFGLEKNNTLVIPYKQEDNIIYAYCPKEDLIGPKKHRMQETLGAWALWAVLMPPAVVLDVVTFPVQGVIYMIGISNIDWH